MNEYLDLIDGDELSDAGLDYALNTVDGSRELPQDMPGNIRILIEEAWNVQDRMLVGSLRPIPLQGEPNGATS